MKYEISTNHNITIKARVDEQLNWRTSITELNIPSKVIFVTEGINDQCDNVKKIDWSFGDRTKVITITNRKQTPSTIEILHTYKPKYTNKNETLSVQASVFTNTELFIVPQFLINSLKQKTVNYVDPIEFKYQILEYYKTKDELPDCLANSIYQIATRLAFAPNFINYSYREEMIGDALIKMLEAIKNHKFNPDKGKPFAYFTKIAYHAFCNRIKKEKKAHEALLHYQSEVYDNLIEGGIIPTRKNTHISTDGEHHDEVVYNEEY